MISPESSSEPAGRGNEPLLSFIVLASVIVGTFYVAKKYIGTIPAVIVAYLIYVYRNDLKKELGELLPHDRH